MPTSVKSKSALAIDDATYKTNSYTQHDEQLQKTDFFVGGVPTPHGMLQAADTDFSEFS